MKMGFHSLCSASALALVLTGCLQDPVEPDLIIDHLEPIAFEAVSADGHPLPAVINSDGTTSVQRELMRASLVLSAPNSLRLILVTQPVAENGALGAAVNDTLRALVGPPDSVIVLSPAGSEPLRLQQQMTYGQDGVLILTVAQPLPSSEGALAARPVELRFQSVEYRP